MPATYEKIATASGTGSSGTITFSSIPSTYTDLILVTNGIATAGVLNALVRFNGDTGSNYSRTSLSYDSSSIPSSRNTNQTYIVVTTDGVVSTGVSTHLHYIMNYNNTNVFKTVLNRNGNVSYAGGYGVDLSVGTWRSTNSITSIDYFLLSNSWATSAKFTLYGIKEK